MISGSRAPEPVAREESQTTSDENPVLALRPVGTGPVRRPLLAAGVLTVLSVTAVLLGSLTWGMVQQRLDKAWDAITITPTPTVAAIAS